MVGGLPPFGLNDSDILGVGPMSPVDSVSSGARFRGFDAWHERVCSRDVRNGRRGTSGLDSSDSACRKRKPQHRHACWV